MGSNLLDRVRGADNLPSPPSVALEVLRLAQSDDASMDEIAQVVQSDPALTARILRVVNSSLFGQVREVTSIRQAMVVLGLRTVKVLVLSFSLVENLRQSQGGEFDYTAYWRRSVVTAASCRLLAGEVAPELAEEAFVAGLLCDLGVVAAVRCAPETYGPVFVSARRHNAGLAEQEAHLLGVTHAELTAVLLTSWGLPEALCQATRMHHGGGFGGLNGAHRKLAQVVHAAAQIAQLFCQDVPPTELATVKETCRTETGIDEAALERILGDLDPGVREVAAMLALPVEPTVDYAQLQADAAAQLAKLSMEAEVERAVSRRREAQALREAQRLEQEKKEILEVASSYGLTRLANRTAFDKRLVEEFRRAKECSQPLGMILMDVDYFKRVNDTYGHQAGDEVLRQIAACVGELSEPLGFAARYGGEEFAVICKPRGEDDLRALAEAIRRKIAARGVRYNGRMLRTTVSVGIAVCNGQGRRESPELLLQAADRCLYLAKRNGRNRVESGQVRVC